VFTLGFALFSHYCITGTGGWFDMYTLLSADDDSAGYPFDKMDWTLFPCLPSFIMSNCIECVSRNMVI